MKSESAVESEVLVAASQLSVQLLKNTSGAMPEYNKTLLKKGVLEVVRWIRFGLGNISKQHNQRCKSPDYVGQVPIVVTQDMVGQLIAIPVYVELKKEGWTYNPKGREKAQKTFLDRQARFGAIAGFVSSVEEFMALIAPYRKNIGLAAKRLRGEVQKQ